MDHDLMFSTHHNKQFIYPGKSYLRINRPRVRKLFERRRKLRSCILKLCNDSVVLRVSSKTVAMCSVVQCEIEECPRVKIMKFIKRVIKVGGNTRI